MQLIVNGDAFDHEGDPSLPALLAALDVDPARVAVMINGRVVTRKARDLTTLREGDKVEVLSFVGGG